MKISIRIAKEEDAPHIVKAEQDIAGEPGYFCSLPSEFSEENVINTINSPKNIYLVAESNNQIVGHVFLKGSSLTSLKHIAKLNIAVHKGFQNQGIGIQLMNEILEMAKNSDSIEKIELNVRASNTRAISLYKKMGFLEEGCLKRHVKTKDGYIDDILMGLDIIK